MASELEKTRHQGIYKRGSRYAVRYRVNGTQRQESARTLDEALRMKRAAGRQTAIEASSRHSRGSRSVNTRKSGSIAIKATAVAASRSRPATTTAVTLAVYAFPFLDERLGRTVSSLSPPRRRELDRLAL